ncbi:uncharacterized protein CBL_12387 [Carabus blaptoides fortunei]
MADPRIRKLTIQTGVVRRLAKEKVMYEKEAQQQRERIEKYKNDGKDEYEIRKQEEVLQESLMMVPDTQRRLMKVYEELKSFLDSEQDLKGTETYITSMKVLEDAKEQLPQFGEVC